MKLKSAQFTNEQKLFAGRPMTGILPERDGVEIEMAGDWVLVRSVKGETKGRVALIHGSRFLHLEPEHDLAQAAQAPERNPPVANRNQGR